MLDFILTVVGYGILALLGLALFFALLAAVLAALPIMLFGGTGLFLIGLPVYLMLSNTAIGGGLSCRRVGGLALRF
jgi:hypothetical protein